MAKTRTLLVGVSTGMGFMAAKQLLEEHDHIVYAGSNDLEPMQPLADIGAHLVEMDVTSTESVNKAVEKMVEEQGGIDCVFYNAGLHLSCPIENASEEEVARLYDVNVFGLGRVIRAVGPVLRKQRAGRLVVTCSIVSHISMMMSGWYASTKHALLGTLTAFRQEVRDFNIDVSMIEPGQINTGFETTSIKKMKQREYIDDYRPIVNQYINFTTRQMDKIPTGEKSASIMVEAITTDKPKFRYRTSPDAYYIPFLKSLLPSKVFDGIFISAFKKHNT